MYRVKFWYPEDRHMPWYCDYTSEQEMMHFIAQETACGAEYEIVAEEVA